MTRAFGLDQVIARLTDAKIDDAAHWAELIEDEVAGLPVDARSQRAAELAEICAGGAPQLAYALGRQKFMGLDLIAERGVIVPRPVTERVGRVAVRLMERMRAESPERPLRVVDMCGGSGNLACGLAHADPRCRVWSCDLMQPASDLATRNAARLGISDRLAVRTGDLFGALDADKLEGTVDLVVCAPPFISTGRLAKDRAHLLEHEPREAFDAGPYGLTIHQRTAEDAARFLRPGGYLVFEVGEGQEKQVAIVFKRARMYDEIQAVEDGLGPIVVVQGRRKFET